MKKYLISLCLLTLSLCSFSTVYGYAKSDKSVRSVEITFVNKTQAVVYVTPAEELTTNPSTYFNFKVTKLKPGAEMTRTYLLKTKHPKVNLMLSLFCKDSEGSGNTISLDLSQSKHYVVDVEGHWIYPGEDFFEAPDPFFYLIAQLRK